MSSIGKATSVLELLARRDEPLGLTEVVRGIDLPKATTRRLLLGLIGEGFVAQGADGRYVLGNGSADLAARSLAGTELSDVGRPRLEALRRHVIGTVVLSSFDDHVLVPVAQSDASTVQFLASSAAAGAHHATAGGKVVLAALPEADVERLVAAQLQRFTANTIGSRAELLQELATIRSRGFALEDEEATPGVRAVSCVLRTFTRRPVGALSVVAPASLVAIGELARSATAVAAAADAISAELGGASVSDRLMTA